MMGTMHGTEIFTIACPDISRGHGPRHRRLRPRLIRAAWHPGDQHVRHRVRERGRQPDPQPDLPGWAESIDPAQRRPVALGVLDVLGRPRTGSSALVRAVLEDLGRDARGPARRAGSPCVGHHGVGADGRAAARSRPSAGPRCPSRPATRPRGVQPSRWVRWPTTQPSPMMVGKPGPAWITRPVLNGRAGDPTVMVP